MIATYTEEIDIEVLACAQRRTHLDIRRCPLGNWGREETDNPKLDLAPASTHLDTSVWLEGIHAMVEREVEKTEGWTQIEKEQQM